MPITHRSPAFFVSLAMVGALCVLGPLLVLWTAGYRLNTTTGALEKTGAMVITTTPTSAQVTLDASATHTDTPARYSTVFPRPYDITITKYGFFPFQETLFVEPGRTSYLTNAHLFPTASSTMVATGTISLLTQSDDGGLLAYALVKKNLTSIVEYRFAQRSSSTLLVTTSTVREMHWAPQGETVLVLTEQNGLVRAMLLSPRGMTPLVLPTNEILLAASWAEGDATRVLLFTKDRNGIARIRIAQAATGESIVVTSWPYSPMLSTPHLAGTLVSFAQTTPTSTLFYDVLAREQATPIFRTTTSPFLVTIRSRDGDVLHLDVPQLGSHGDLSLKDGTTFVLLPGMDPVRSPIGTTTLAANASTIFLDGTPADPITRNMTSITGRSWADADTVLVSTPTDITAFTTQTFRGQHHRTQLVQFTGGTGMVVYRKTLYFTGTIDGVSGLYEYQME